jgi:hypothetical protein
VDDSFFDLDMGKHKGDSIAIFGLHAVQDTTASEEAGHPVYKEKDYVRIISPGNDKEIVHRAVKEEDKERWPREWAAYQNREEVPIEGMILSEWAQITKAQALTLEGMHIRTVEQLAEVNDQSISNMGMGFRELKNKAQEFVKYRSGEAKLQSYAQQLRRAKEREDQLEKSLDDLQKQVAGLEKELAARTDK